MLAALLKTFLEVNQCLGKNSRPKKLSEVLSISSIPGGRQSCGRKRLQGSVLHGGKRVFTSGKPETLQNREPQPYKLRIRHLNHFFLLFLHPEGPRRWLGLGSGGRRLLCQHDSRRGHIQLHIPLSGTCSGH